MTKKIYDILPPKAENKIESLVGAPVAAQFASNKPNVHFKKNRNEKKPLSQSRTRHLAEAGHKKVRNIFSLKNALFGAGILVFILFGFLYFKLQKVDVEIWPKTELLDFKETVIMDQSVDFINQENKIIPAKIIEETKDMWLSFETTGISNSKLKASGTIRVYNKFSPAKPITLVKGTHFLSDSGKYFVAPEKIVIPAAQTKSGKTTPGSVDVKVEAQEAGEDYNIKPSKFSVPKLVGTAYYYTVYAESFLAMAGGSLEQVKKVSEDDLQNAKNITAKKLLEDIEKSLKEKISDEYILIDSAIFKEITEAGSAIKLGVLVGNFNYQAKAKVAALVFKKADLDKFVNSYIASKITAEKTLLPDSLKINFSSEKPNVKAGKMAVDLDFSIKNYKAVNKDDLIALFREKSAVEIKDIIRSRLENPEKIKIDLWPFWTTKAPSDKTKIKLDLKFE